MLLHFHNRKSFLLYITMSLSLYEYKKKTADLVIPANTKDVLKTDIVCVLLVDPPLILCSHFGSA
jgi:hypothetical protein